MMIIIRNVIHPRFVLALHKNNITALRSSKINHHSGVIDCDVITKYIGITLFVGGNKDIRNPCTLLLPCMQHVNISTRMSDYD